MAKKIKSKIFLIEDDPGIIDVYSIAFEAAGIPFESIALGQKAIQRIKDIQENKEEKPSLILLDLLLPDMNGLEVLSQIRQYEATKNITVFVLSNFTNSQASPENSVKPDKYIMKADITPTQLVKLIKKQLEAVKSLDSSV